MIAKIINILILFLTWGTTEVFTIETDSIDNYIYDQTLDTVITGTGATYGEMFTKDDEFYNLDIINTVTDEFVVTGNIIQKKTNVKSIILEDSHIINISNYTYVQRVFITLPNDVLQSYAADIYFEDYPLEAVYPYDELIDIDKWYNALGDPTDNLYILKALGTYATRQLASDDLVGLNVKYELATPIYTDIYDFTGYTTPTISEFETMLKDYELIGLTYRDVFGDSLYGEGKTNLIENGDFSDGTTGWVCPNDTMTWESGGYVKISAPDDLQSSLLVLQEIDEYIDDNIYYVSMKMQNVKLTNVKISAHTYSLNVLYEGIGNLNFEYFSFANGLSSYSNNEFNIYSQFTGNFVEDEFMLVDDVMLFNLTELFGEENLEPTLTNFETYLTYYNTYLDNYIVDSTVIELTNSEIFTVILYLAFDFIIIAIVRKVVGW
jgi:hypothetical protein